MNWDKYLMQNQSGLADFHVHTTYCDGSSSPEETILAAIDKGMKTVGFSGHCHTPYDESYCMLPEDVAAYEKEIRELAGKYADRIEVLCGIEQDCLAGCANVKGATADGGRWDYAIGSCHYIKTDTDFIAFEGMASGYVPVDETPEIIRAAIAECFGGDPYALTELYYETVADAIELTGADIIGHLDLVAKFNEGGENGGKGRFFDEDHPRYVTAWKKAVDKLVKTGKPFEINMNGMAKEYRTEPYPSEPIRNYIKEKGGTFILSSDSHKASNLCIYFDKKMTK